MTSKQLVTSVALVFAAVLSLAFYLRFSGWNRYESAMPAAHSASETFDCIIRSVQDPRVDYDACVDRVQRKYGTGPYAHVAWQEQHPALAALIAGGVAFFVLAGGARLFLE